MGGEEAGYQVHVLRFNYIEIEVQLAVNKMINSCTVGWMYGHLNNFLIFYKVAKLLLKF